MSNTIDSLNILQNIPDKSECRRTTTTKFKTDLIDFFSHEMWRSKYAVELGTNKGYSTHLMSHLFKHVYSIDNHREHLDEAIEFNTDRSNIEFLYGDVYTMNWPSKVSKRFDIMFSDCVHTTEAVEHDIRTALKFGSSDVVLIFDDYGNNVSGVKSAIRKFVRSGELKILKFIGIPMDENIYGDVYTSDWEGVICTRNLKSPYPDGYGRMLRWQAEDVDINTIVEFGTSHGYTSLMLGEASRKSGERVVYTYDTYRENSGASIEKTRSLIDRFDLNNIVKPETLDIDEWLESPIDFDLLYIDIHNDGEKLERIVNHPHIQLQLSNGAVILFEGGSDLRNSICKTRKVSEISDVTFPYTVIFGDNLRHSLSIII